MTPQVVDKDLFEYALLNPILQVGGPDSIKIVSGYATHAMAARHLIETTARAKKLDVDLVCGMTGTEGISRPNHMGFLSLQARKEFVYDGSFSCSYVKKPLSVHSKVYVWCKNGAPVQAFIGSANYSETGFHSPSRIETLAECDPLPAMKFFESIKLKSVACDKVNFSIDLPRRQRSSVPNASVPGVVEIEMDKESAFYNHEKIRLSLLTRDGKTGNGSRLNWGVRPDGKPRMSENSNGAVSRRNPDQSYIGLPAVFQKCGFFPEVGHRFSVLTDDNQIFTCVRAQANGKGIETPQDNSEIGRYFRNRLGLQSGAYIDVSDLERYGRTDVTFYKLNDEEYVMDFSVAT